MSAQRILPLGGLLAALACSSSDPSVPREVGVVLPGVSGVEVIEAPDTVYRNEPFTVVVNTFGSQCTVPTGVALRLDGNAAHITPFDRVNDEMTPCPRDYGPRPHPVEVVLTELGAGTIVVKGASVGGTAPGRTLVTVRKEIWVERK